jgi:RHS repeat-associated protein
MSGTTVDQSARTNLEPEIGGACHDGCYGHKLVWRSGVSPEGGARRYDPYGTLLIGATESGYSFTGREWDADIGLYYYRARYYDPTLGRFISADPAGFADGPNNYTYVMNRPTTMIDPYGLQTWPTN